MSTVQDVAAYILQKLGPTTVMKLQKLVYYTQAWSLVWDERPLFGEPLEAWANGPVCPPLYEAHRGRYKVESLGTGDPSALDVTARETVDAVLRGYGGRSSQWLSDLTHSEAPWRDARREAPEGARSNAVITHEAMAEYYAALGPDNAQLLTK